MSSIYYENKQILRGFLDSVDLNKGNGEKQFLQSTVFGGKVAKSTDQCKEIAKHSADYVKAVLIVGPACVGKTTYVKKFLLDSKSFFRGASYVNYDYALEYIGRKHMVNPYEKIIDEKYEEEIDDRFCEMVLDKFVVNPTLPVGSQLVIIEGPFSDILNRAAMLLMLRDMGVHTAIIDFSSVPNEKRQRMVLSRALDVTCAKRYIAEAEEIEEDMPIERQIFLYRHGLDMYLKAKNGSFMRTIAEIEEKVDAKETYKNVVQEIDLESVRNKYQRQHELGIDKLGAEVYYSIYDNKRD